MSTLYLMERHDQLLDVWQEMSAKHLSVAHLDFHCDMRDLLVDQSAQRAYWIRSGLPRIDEGNFITHAILEGRVGRIRWIHDVPGGRRDDVAGVKLTSDWTAQWIWWRLKRRGELGVPFSYEEMMFFEWNDLEPDQFLDIDWDVFACKDYPVDSCRQRIEAFRRRKFSCKPKDISLCYSSDYSHSTRKEFEDFAKYLSDLFGAKIVRLLDPPPLRARYTSFLMTAIARPLYREVRRSYLKGLRWLRYRGIY